MDVFLTFFFANLSLPCSSYTTAPATTWCVLHCLNSHLPCNSVFYHESSQQCCPSIEVHTQDSASLVPRDGTLYFVQPLLIPVTPVIKCPSGSTLFTSESVCVTLTPTKMPWQNAYDECARQSYNGKAYRLISFKTQEKYLEVKQYLGTDPTGVWTGLRYNDGKWKWHDGTVAAVQPWHYSEPNLLGAELCAVIYRPTGWTMHNNYCSAKWSAMCEVSAFE